MYNLLTELDYVKLAQLQKKLFRIEKRFCSSKSFVYNSITDRIRRHSVIYVCLITVITCLCLNILNALLL